MLRLVPVLVVALLTLIFSGCATVSKDKVGVVKEGPSVSPVLQEEAPERVLKRKVAIARFTNETKYGKGFFAGTKDVRIENQATDILSAKLAATEKFILLERADLDRINEELALGGLDKLKLPADYLIVGSISEFGRKDTSKVGVFSRTKKQTAYASVNIRLIDVSTGQIIYSEEGSAEAFSEVGTVMGMGSKAGLDSTLNDKVISGAIQKLVSDIVENLLERPWRSYVLSYEDGTYIVAGGETQGIINGDVFGLFEKGKTVTNPQTNMPIELPGKMVGKIQVMATSGKTENNEVSLCTLVDGIAPATSSFANYYVQEL